MDTINYWISQYGYLGIFVLLMLGIFGLPVPDETIITLSGFLIYKGELSLIPTFLSAFAGSAIGITISYVVGRLFGYYVLLRIGKYIHFTEDKLERVKSWFEKLGKWTLTIGYFIPGVRHFTAIVAGSSKFNIFSFAIFAYSGAALWAVTFLSIGYIFGKQWMKILDSIHSHIIVFAAVLLVIIIAGYFIRQYIVKKRNQKK